MSSSTKPVKNKPVRDSFTMPRLEYAHIASIKQRAAQLGRPTKKSEVLRAAVALLNNLSDKDLQVALQALPSIKTGRPKAASVPAVAKKVKVEVVPVKQAPAKKVAAKKAVASKPAAKKATPAKASKA